MQNKSKQFNSLKFGDEKKWERLFKTSRPDYVHLRVFSWAENSEALRHVCSDGKNERLADSLIGYYGETVGRKVMQEFISAESDIDRINEISLLSSMHIRNVAYAHSMLVRSPGRNNLDERLDLEFAIQEWCYQSSQGMSAYSNGSVLIEDWASADMMMSHLSPEVRDAVTADIEMMKKMIPLPDPDVDPDKYDMGDVYESGTFITSALLSRLTEDDTGFEIKKAIVANDLSHIDEKNTQELIFSLLKRLQKGGNTNLKEMDKLPARDWDILSAEDAKRLSASIGDVIRSEFNESDKNVFARIVGLIDQMYEDEERSIDCQMTKLASALELLDSSAKGIKHRKSGREMLDELERKGFISEKEKNRLKTIGGCLNRLNADNQGKWKDAKTRALLFEIAGGDRRALESVLVVKLVDDIVSGRIDDSNPVQTDVVRKIRNMIDGDLKRSNRITVIQKTR